MSEPLFPENLLPKINQALIEVCADFIGKAVDPNRDEMKRRMIERIYSVLPDSHWLDRVELDIVIDEAIDALFGSKFTN